MPRRRLAGAGRWAARPFLISESRRIAGAHTKSSRGARNAPRRGAENTKLPRGARSAPRRGAGNTKSRLFAAKKHESKKAEILLAKQSPAANGRGKSQVRFPASGRLACAFCAPFRVALGSKRYLRKCAAFAHRIAFHMAAAGASDVDKMRSRACCLRPGLRDLL